MNRNDYTGAILIVAKNNLHLTKIAVRSALSQDVPCTLLVCDNASTDGTVDWLKSKTGLVYLPQKRQESLSYCWNKGIKAFFDCGHDSVLVCNNDIELRPDAFRILHQSPFPFTTCISVDSTERRGVAGDRNAEELYAAARPHPDFSAYLIKREVVNKVGYFDESYFPAYVEDCDYHLRMHKAGIKAVCIDLPFVHHGASTIKSADPGEAERIKRGAQRNRERFRQKYGCLPGTTEYQELFK